MAAYAMTELDDKKTDDAEKKDEEAPSADGEQPVPTEKKEKDGADGSSSPSEGAEPKTDAGEPNQTDAAPTPTKDTSQQSNEILNANPSQSAAVSNDVTVDTSAPAIEEKSSAEVTPSNADEKSRKRPHSELEEEEAPSSFNPPPRPQNGKSETKVELFRKPTANDEIPFPERNVSADSADNENVTAANGDGANGPPAKKAAVESTQ